MSIDKGNCRDRARMTFNDEVETICIMAKKPLSYNYKPAPNVVMKSPEYVSASVAYFE